MKKIDSLNADMYTSDVFQILFDYEVSRCKRYPSPLTLIQLEMAPIAISAEALSAAPGIFSSALNTHLRSVDIPSKAENVFTLLLDFVVPEREPHFFLAVVITGDRPGADVGIRADLRIADGKRQHGEQRRRRRHVHGRTQRPAQRAVRRAQ